MAHARYRLPDEPTPSFLARHAVDPVWPLLASMLGNNAIGLAWFAFNATALGTPTKIREYAYIGVSIIGSMVLFLALGSLNSSGLLQGSELRYASLSLIALKLSISYTLYLSQHRSFEIWEHYGGKPANALPILLLAFLAGRSLSRLDSLPAIVMVAVQ